MRDSVNCRVDEVRYFVKIVDVVRVDQVRVDQVRVDQVGCTFLPPDKRVTIFFRETEN